MTSFAFMFVEVPAPPWNTSSRNSSCSLPSMISWQAPSMPFRMSALNWPQSKFARAAANLTMPSALMMLGYSRSSTPEMWKFSSARAVCTP